jgi:BlaI family transcriptional regulator, penicillinase repressor
MCRSAGEKPSTSPPFLASRRPSGSRVLTILKNLRNSSLTMYEVLRRKEAMTKKSLPRPTEAELELLRVLWNRGPSTVREIHDSLGEEKKTGYTTTLKILQLMAEKGLVKRDESRKSHVYRAVSKPEQTQRQLVRDLSRRAFGGSPGKLVVQALLEQQINADELAEIREILNKLEAEHQRKGESTK